MDDAVTVRFAERFRGRPGVYARMWHHPRRGTGYSPVHAPLDAEVARAHLEGRITIGSYLVRDDQRVSHAVIDLDASREALASAERDRHAAEGLRQVVHLDSLRLAEALRATGLAPLLVDSGYKGRHLWCFLEEPVLAEQARASLRSATKGVTLDARLRLELFPKQDRVRQGGLGNLVKLPLGVHLRTGQLAKVLDEQGEAVKDGLERLLAWPRTPLTPVGLLGPEPEEPPEAPDLRAQQVVRSCPMIRAVLDNARQERVLSHDAVVVLNHSLGHLPGGVDLLQEVYARIPELPEAAEPQAPRRGYPISCGRIRQRLAEFLQRVPCHCVFPERSGSYDHPLRHVDADHDLDHLVGALAESRRRGRELEAEVAERLGTETGARHVVDGGVWVRGPDGGVQFVHDGRK